MESRKIARLLPGDFMDTVMRQHWRTFIDAINENYRVNIS
jgi:hypothetical protein